MKVILRSILTVVMFLGLVACDRSTVHYKRQKDGSLRAVAVSIGGEFSYRQSEIDEFVSRGGNDEVVWDNNGVSSH